MEDEEVGGGGVGDDAGDDVDELSALSGHAPSKAHVSASPSSTSGLLSGSPLPSCWAVVPALYGCPKLFRLLRFVLLSVVGLLMLSALLFWTPLDSPLHFIARQGVLFLAIGLISASSIAVF